jgi:hypothetical protein
VTANQLSGATANKQDGARLDISARSKDMCILIQDTPLFLSISLLAEYLTLSGSSAQCKASKLEIDIACITTVVDNTRMWQRVDEVTRRARKNRRVSASDIKEVTAFLALAIKYMHREDETSRDASHELHPIREAIFLLP